LEHRAQQRDHPLGVARLKAFACCGGPRVAAQRSCVSEACEVRTELGIGPRGFC